MVHDVYDAVSGLALALARPLPEPHARHGVDYDVYTVRHLPYNIKFQNKPSSAPNARSIRSTARRQAASPSILGGGAKRKLSWPGRYILISRTTWLVSDPRKYIGLFSRESSAAGIPFGLSVRYVLRFRNTVCAPDLPLNSGTSSLGPAPRHVCRLRARLDGGCFALALAPVHKHGG